MQGTSVVMMFDGPAMCRNLNKYFLTCHLTLWQRLDRTRGHYTYRKTCRDRTCHSPYQIHPDAWSASVTSTNEKPSQPMLQSSGPSHSIDWLNAILPGPVKLRWACFGLRASVLICELGALLRHHCRRCKTNKSCRRRRLTLPNTAT